MGSKTFLSAFILSLLVVQLGLANGPAYIENKGQWDSRVLFLAHGVGSDIWITRDGAVYDFLGKRQGTGHVVSMRTLGGSVSTVSGKALVPGTLNYFIGHHIATNVRQFAEVDTNEVYPGISLKWGFTSGAPTCSFVIRPGANPAQIRLAIEGAQSLGSRSTGEFQLGTSVGPVTGLVSAVDQNNEPVPAQAVLSGQVLSVQPGQYDSSKAISVTTCIRTPAAGGSGGGGGAPVSGGPGGFGSTLLGAYATPFGVAVDNLGATVVTGYAPANAFPTTKGAYKHAPNSSQNVVFLTKLSLDLRTVVFSSLLGGTVTASGNGDQGNSVAIDSNGNIFVGGFATTIDFPFTSGTYQSGTASNGSAGFVAKFSYDGARLLFSDSLTGSGISSNQGIRDVIRKIALDPSGNVLAVGSAMSPDYPHTLGTYSFNVPSNPTACFSKLSADGKHLLFSGYVGNQEGFGSDGCDVFVDNKAQVYVAGTSYGGGIPVTPGAYSFPGNYPSYSFDFIFKLSANGSNLLKAALASPGYAVFGTGPSGISLSVDSTGEPVLMGQAPPNTLHTAGAYQWSGIGTSGTDFVCKLSSDFTKPIFYANLGVGGAHGMPTSLWIDSVGNIVAGGHNIDGFPRTPGGFFDLTQFYYSAGFVAMLNAQGSKLLYSGMFGGDGDPGVNSAIYVDNLAYAMAPTPYGNMVLVGTTTSGHYPITTSAPQNIVGTSNGFVTRITLPTLSGLFLTSGNWVVSDVIGGRSLEGYVVLGASTGVALPVALSTSDSIATVAGTTIPVGLSYVTFNVNTKPVTALVKETLTAKVNGLTQQTTFNVQPYGVIGVSFAQPSVTGGLADRGTVTISSPAPTGGALIQLSSSDPTLGTVPVGIRIPAGSTSGTFLLTGLSIVSDKTVTVTATANGVFSSADVLVKSPRIAGIKFASPTVGGGAKVNATVSLTGKAPTGGTKVALSVSTGGYLTAPASVTVPAGANSVVVACSSTSPFNDAVVTLTGTVLDSTARGAVTVKGVSQLQLIGRWDAKFTSGPASGDIGMLITSAMPTSAKGQVMGAPFTATIKNDTLSFTFKGGNQTVKSTLLLTDGRLTGTFILSSGPLNVVFALQSKVPVDPFVGGPKVVSLNLVNGAVVVSWDRPVGGSWDFGLVSADGKTVVKGYRVAEQNLFTYSPATHTMTMPFSTASMPHGTYTLSLEEPFWSGPVPDWFDPYGAPAWSSPSQVYTKQVTF